MTSHDRELRETVRVAFQRYDTDDSGSMDARELRQLVSELGGFLSEQQLRAALVALDRDGNGMIDEDEFAAWWMAKAQAHTKLGGGGGGDDLDGDGRVDEFEKMLARVKAEGRQRFHVDLHSAAWQGQVASIQRMLEPDANPTEDGSVEDRVRAKDTTEYGNLNTALHYAAYQGHVDICALLLAAGASVNATNGAGCTPLFLAVQQSRKAVVELLLQKGADIRVPETEHKFTAVDVCTDDSILALFRGLAGAAPCAPAPAQLSTPRAHALRVSWSAPRDAFNQTAPVSGYQVALRPVAVSVSPRILLVPAQVTDHLVEGLEPDTEYVAHVAALNLHGISEPSAASLPLRTRPAAPSPPTRLIARSDSPQTVTLTWTWSSEPPPPGTTLTVQKAVEEPASLERLWKDVGVCAADAAEFIVTGLFADCRYFFRVAAVTTSTGQGAFSSVVSVRSGHTTTPTVSSASLAQRTSNRRNREALRFVARVAGMDSKTNVSALPVLAPSYPRPELVLVSSSSQSDRSRGTPPLVSAQNSMPDVSPRGGLHQDGKRARSLNMAEGGDGQGEGDKEIITSARGPSLEQYEVDLVENPPVSASVPSQMETDVEPLQPPTPV